MNARPQAFAEFGRGDVKCDSCSTRSQCLIYNMAAANRAAIHPFIVEQSVKVGQQIDVQGSQSQTLKVIKVGLFKGERSGTDNSDESDTPVCLFGKGRIAGFSSLYKQPAPLSMTAITPARVCEVPISIAYDMAFPDRGFRQFLYGAVARYIATLADWSRVTREIGLSRQLYLTLQLIADEEGSASFRIPSHIELAKLLGARRESIARHINQLITKGYFIKSDRWHGTVVSGLPLDKCS